MLGWAKKGCPPYVRSEGRASGYDHPERVNNRKDGEEKVE